MPLITRGQRIFFAVICAAALLVAILGLFNPAYLASIFTWLELPPLHARFVGAIYAFGAVFMAGCLGGAVDRHLDRNVIRHLTVEPGCF